MKKFAVVISGSGVFDGAEIHETVMSLYAIAKNGAEYKIFAPDINQYHVVNHLNGKITDEVRNVLIESARIARGKIKPLNEFDATDFDVLFFPGGFGVAKNLSDFAFKGENCKINSEVEKAVKQMVERKKPVAALCIAPAVFAKILDGVKVTIGQDSGTIEKIKKMNGQHQITNHGEVVFDEKYNFYSTPCYMLDASIVDIANGTDNIVKMILKNLDD